MAWAHLPLDATLAAYDAQAAALLLAWRAGDPEAIDRFRHGLPRFLREDVPWLPKTSPLRTALTFGYLDAARALVRRGATVTSLAEAAGLGDRAAVVARLADAAAEDRHRALALAAAVGHVEVVGTLIDAGEDPNRYNPPNGHAHSTPLHQAVAAAHLHVVQLLVVRGARLDLRDTLYDATPLGWAEYLQQPAIADLLRRHGAGL